MYENIISCLDKKYVQGKFPIFDGENWIFSRSILTAFREKTNWSLIFEMLVYFVPMSSFTNMIYIYGNNVKDSYSFEWLDVFESAQSEPLDRDGFWEPDVFNFSIILRNKETLTMNVSEKEYHDKGIDIEFETNRSHNGITGWTNIKKHAAILRFLSYTIPDKLFVSLKELLYFSCLPDDILPFIRLSEWHHPFTVAGERPSDSPCIKSLAFALSQGNPNLYHCPREVINTHWNNWPEWPYRETQ